MKKYYTLFSLFCLPLCSIAQPVVTKAEHYTIGTTTKRLICDPTPPGAGGANVTWDFSTLTPTGDTQVSRAEAPPVGNAFPGADFVMHGNDSSYTYFDTAGNQINMLGIIDSSSNGVMITYSNPMLIMDRPVTYNDMGMDSFYSFNSFQGTDVYSAGEMSYISDGYGTLILPYDTFQNVLRVKTLIMHHDSIDGVGNYDVAISSVLWYMDTIASPLLRIDSIEITGIFSINQVDVQYLYSVEPTSIKGTLKSEKINASAYLGEKELVLTGAFENGKEYQASVYSMNGQKLFSNDFTANGQRAQFSTGDISNGTYVITIRRKGDISSITAFKVVKQ